jgi:hypothetical protein
MKEKIIQYIHNKFPESLILLHGSRTTSYGNEKSDWDIYVFADTHEFETKEIFERIDEQNLDIKVFSRSLPDEKIIKEIAHIIHGYEILFDNDNLLRDWVNHALVLRSGGYNHHVWTNTRLLLLRVIDRLESRSDNYPIFYMIIAKDFLPWAIDLWFKIIQNEYSLPYYQALPEIQFRDSEYYNLLEVLWSDSDNHKKLIAAKEIFSKLFP